MRTPLNLTITINHRGEANGLIKRQYIRKPALIRATKPVVFIRRINHQVDAPKDIANVVERAAGIGQHRCIADGFFHPPQVRLVHRLAGHGPGDQDGIVRVGRVAGGEPYLLLGHRERINTVAVSPDGRWVAAADQGGTIRLWPMPDLTKAPLHVLPHGELLSRLRSFTNLRAVADEDSPGGYRVDAGPFPGWGETPEW